MTSQITLGPLDLVNNIRYTYLNSSITDDWNLLTASGLTEIAATNSITPETVVFGYDLGALQPGSILNIDAERLFVVSVDQSAKTAQCIRAFQSPSVYSDKVSYDTTLHAGYAPVWVNPRFDVVAILTAIDAEIRALSSPALGLFQILSTDLTYDAAVQGYDLNPDDLRDTPASESVISIQGAYTDSPGPEKDWVELDNWKLQPNMSSTDFPGGNSSNPGWAIVFSEGGYPGQTIRVLYKAPYDTFGGNVSAGTTALTGLQRSVIDIVELGAAIRLLTGREVRRNDITTQGDSRRSEEVAAGNVTGALRNLAALRQQRIGEEAARLRALYPDRRH